MNLSRIHVAGVAVFLSVFGVSGCAHSLTDVCNEDVKKWNASLESFSEALKKVESANRSVSSEAAALEVAEKSGKWEDWSELQLKVVQKDIDATVGSNRDKVRMKAALTEIANYWIEFHGFAQLKQIPRMLQTLEKIRARQKKLEKVDCSTIGRGRLATP